MSRGNVRINQPEHPFMGICRLSEYFWFPLGKKRQLGKFYHTVDALARWVIGYLMSTIRPMNHQCTLVTLVRSQHPDSFRQPRHSCLDSPLHSLNCQLISVIITTLSIHHSITLSLHAQKLVNKAASHHFVKSEIASYVQWIEHKFSRQKSVSNVADLIL